MTTNLPSRIYASASVKSVGGVSLFDEKAEITPETVEQFYGKPELINEAAFRLRRVGFQVLSASELGIYLVAPAKVYGQVFKVEIIPIDKGTNSLGKPMIGLTCKDSDRLGFIDPSKSVFANLLEGIAISQPVNYLTNISAKPPDKPQVSVTEKYKEYKESFPLKEYLYPDEISGKLGLKKEQQQKEKNKNPVKIAIVDSGCFSKHPFFSNEKKIKVFSYKDPKQEITDDNDKTGHGTSMVANALAIAPDAEVIMVKEAEEKGNTSSQEKEEDTDTSSQEKEEDTDTSSQYEVAIQNACKLGADIISCSWGTDVNSWGTGVENGIPANWVELKLVCDEVIGKQNKVVLFAAGNGGEITWESLIPDTISVGGAYFGKIDGKSVAYASDYASSSDSNDIKKIRNGRLNESQKKSTTFKFKERVPDIAGLCGPEPYGRVIAAI